MITEDQFCYQHDDSEFLENFCNDPRLMKVFIDDYSPTRVRKVTLSEIQLPDNPDNCYWGYWCNEEKSLIFVYRYLLQLKTCSGDFFKSDIESGKGRIVPLNASIIKNVMENYSGV